MSEEQNTNHTHPRGFGLTAASQETKDNMLEVLSGFFLVFDAAWSEMHRPQLTEEQFVELSETLEAMRNLTITKVKSFVDADPALMKAIAEARIKMKNSLN